MMKAISQTCFIDCKDFICPFLTSILKFIYILGNYSDAWTKAAIVLLFQKGDINNPECDRGSTMVNITEKKNIISSKKQVKQLV